jgi:hypothetical protein
VQRSWSKSKLQANELTNGGTGKGDLIGALSDTSVKSHLRSRRPCFVVLTESQLMHVILSTNPIGNRRPDLRLSKRIATNIVKLPQLLQGGPSHDPLAGTC